jgi:hypothetical protein
MTSCHRARILCSPVHLLAKAGRWGLCTFIQAEAKEMVLHGWAHPALWLPGKSWTQLVHWCPDSDQTSYSAVQIGPSVSYCAQFALFGGSSTDHAGPTTYASNLAYTLTITPGGCAVLLAHHYLL